MKAGDSPGSKEIVDLLSKLKTRTPEYPTEKLATRRAAFLKQVVAVTNQVHGRGGKTGLQGDTAE